MSSWWAWSLEILISMNYKRKQNLNLKLGTWSDWADNHLSSVWVHHLNILVEGIWSRWLWRVCALSVTAPCVAYWAILVQLILSGDVLRESSPLPIPAMVPRCWWQGHLCVPLYQLPNKLIADGDLTVLVALDLQQCCHKNLSYCNLQCLATLVMKNNAGFEEYLFCHQKGGISGN